jgi:outer membrane protein assembly factor BamB
MFTIAAALALSLTLAPQTPSAPQQPAPAAITEELWNAARAGDAARVTKALEAGADMQAKTRYGATALTFAADKGHVEVVKLLLDRGADPNAQDTFYRMRALDMALANKHHAVAVLLLERGSKGAGAALMGAVQSGNVAIAQAALASADITIANLNAALAAARRSGDAGIIALIEKKIAAMPAEPARPTVAIERSVLQSYTGTYRNDTSGLALIIALNGDQLTSARPGQPPLTLVPTSQTTFTLVEIEGLTLTFAGRGGPADSLVLTQNNTTQTLLRVAATPPAAPGATPAPGAAGERSGRAGMEVPPATEKPAEAAPTKPAARTAPRPWPAFRGDNASGNGDGQGAVTEWNVADGRNVRWTTPIPGIANASPIVWGTRVFVVTAVSSAGDKTFRTGLYGDVAPVNDLSEHTWKIYCLDQTSGKILWEQTAFTGLPKVKRHPKASQANSTPVTDGTRVVALFGSIGMLAAWDMNGKPLWKADVGVLDSGWFFDPTYQWGHASSPIIYKGTAIVQADVHKRSFIAAYDLKTGKQVWRTERDEIPTWGTPTVFGEQIVTNGPKIRGYDAATGRLLWTLGPNSEVAVGTPVVGEGLVYVTGGYPPARPIYAVKPTAAGDISLPKDATSSDAIAWSNTSGTYIPTPIYYDGILYTCSNEGVLTAYDAKTGERVYRARVGGGGSFAASPIAADGRLYFANEDGDVIVARAGRTYEELARNQMKEVIMGTPAISDGFIIVRTMGHVYGIANP